MWCIARNIDRLNELKKLSDKIVPISLDLSKADSFNNKISNESPLGNAIMGHKVGDEVVVQAPNGSYTVKITKVA